MDRYKNRVTKYTVSKSTTHRQDKIKKNETIDYYEKEKAHKYAYQPTTNYSIARSDRGLSGNKKVKGLAPAVGQYNPERAYKILSA